MSAPVLPQITTTTQASVFAEHVEEKTGLVGREALIKYRDANLQAQTEQQAKIAAGQGTAETAGTVLAAMSRAQLADQALALLYPPAQRVQPVQSATTSTRGATQ